MGITLNLTVSTPLSEEDDQILAGAGYWLMAIANRNGQVAPPEDGVSSEDDEAAPCLRSNDSGELCVREAGHSGRHRYRPAGSEVRLN
jgi:hypothetical protein